MLGLRSAIQPAVAQGDVLLGRMPREGAGGATGATVAAEGGFEVSDRARPASPACAWCGEPVPAAPAGAYVVHTGEHELPVCSAGCLAELVALVAGVRLGVGRG